VNLKEGKYNIECSRDEVWTLAHAMMDMLTKHCLDKAKKYLTFDDFLEGVKDDPDTAEMLDNAIFLFGLVSDGGEYVMQELQLFHSNNRIKSKGR